MCRIPTDYHELDTIFNHVIRRDMTIVGFTSASRSVGVTSVIKSLAYRFQMAEMRVLLVDTNCHHPALSSEQRGADWGAIMPYDRDIDVLSLPDFEQSPQWLMKLRNNQVMRTKLAECRDHYDVILMDTSAINNVNRGNLPAERMLEHCEAVYLVVKAGISKRTEIIHAVSLIKANELNLVGTVYNDVDNPSLAMELQRETFRLDNTLPKLGEWIRAKVQQSHLLNIIL